MPYYTALENVALPLSFRGVPKAARIKRAEQMLEIVGPGNASDAQARRTLRRTAAARWHCARALVTNPEIVFADEPTGNLDSNTSDEVMRVIIDILREQKKTLVMVTHDSHIAAFGDKVINLLDGRITDITINSDAKLRILNPIIREN